MIWGTKTNIKVDIKETDSSDSGYGPMVGSFKYGNELSKNGAEFLDYLSYKKLLKTVFAPWI
jgi:hypothetical protein